MDVLKSIPAVLVKAGPGFRSRPQLRVSVRLDAIAEGRAGAARRFMPGRVTGAGAGGSGEAGSAGSLSIRPVPDDEWVIVAGSGCTPAVISVDVDALAVPPPGAPPLEAVPLEQPMIISRS
jgi:hypothetical protein